MNGGRGGAGRLGDRPAPAAPAPGTAEEDARSHPAPAGHRGAPAPGPVLDVGSGSVSFGGSYVAGDQHGVSGGRVTGDVVMGGKTERERP